MSDSYLLVKDTFGLTKTSDLQELQNVVDHTMFYVTLTILHISLPNVSLSIGPYAGCSRF